MKIFGNVKRSQSAAERAAHELIKVMGAEKKAGTYKIGIQDAINDRAKPSFAGWRYVVITIDDKVVPRNTRMLPDVYKVE